MWEKYETLIIGLASLITGFIISFIGVFKDLKRDKNDDDREDFKAINAEYRMLVESNKQMKDECRQELADMKAEIQVLREKINGLYETKIK